MPNSDGNANVFRDTQVEYLRAYIHEITPVTERITLLLVNPADDEGVIPTAEDGGR